MACRRSMTKCCRFFQDKIISGTHNFFGGLLVTRSVLHSSRSLSSAEYIGFFKIVTKGEDEGQSSSEFDSVVLLPLLNCVWIHILSFSFLKL